MKNTLFRLARLLVIPAVLLSAGGITEPAIAQEPTPVEAYAEFTEAELAQMLAPIALYPDALLAQVLMASTYPIEVIEADRWLAQNQELTGDALDEALLERDWDPSVKSLCHFPSVLTLMSERIGETTDIGNAFLAQEAGVMEMVQRLRTEAHARGHLASNAQQTVVVQSGTIVIEPANPAVVYVPYYDPYYVYGPWWYPAYPPYYWGPVGAGFGVGFSYWPEIYFGVSYGAWSYFDWPRHYIHIDIHRRPRFVKHDRWIVRSDRWHHAPHHRRGIAYRNLETTRKYGRTTAHFGRTAPDTHRFHGRIDRERTSARRGDRRTGIGRVQPRVESAWRKRRQPDQRRTGPARQVQERSVRESSKRVDLKRNDLHRKPVAAVRQDNGRSARDQQKLTKPALRRPAHNPQMSNRQSPERFVREPANRTHLKRGKPERHRVEPARKIRQRQQVKIARNPQPQTTPPVLPQNGQSGQYSKRSESGSEHRFSSYTDRSWRGNRSSGARANGRFGEGSRRGGGRSR